MLNLATVIALIKSYLAPVKTDITEIDSDVDKVKDATITMTVEPSGQDVDISTQLTYENGKYVNKSGYVGLDNQYKCTNKIAVEEGEIYKTTNNYTTWRFVCAYNGDTPVEEKGAVGQQSYTVPTGITHIIITLYSDIQTNSKAVVKQSTTVVYHNSANALVSAEQTSRESADNAISAVTIKEKPLQKEIDLCPSLEFVEGQYINLTGYNGRDANYNRTTKFAVNVGEVYKITWSSSNWRYVTAYNGNTAIEAKGASNVNTYTVPEGVTHLVITLYADNVLTYKSIIRVVPVKVYENSAEKAIDPSFVKRKARVTFIDDDGYAEFYTHLVPIMQEYHVPMCSAYMGDVCPTFTNPTYMTEEQCRTVEQLGGEIVVHGGTSLTDFATVAQAEANVIASKNALEAHGFKSDVYVYPGSANNIAIREMMARHFKCAFKTGYPQKGDSRVNDKCVPHYFIHRVSAGGYFDDKTATYGNYDTYTMDYFEAVIDDAVSKGGWLVFMTHAWMMPIGCSYRLEHDSANGIPADLDEFELIADIVEYIQTLKANGADIEIVNASDGFELFKNEVQAGDYLGYWNETYSGINQFEHSKAGFAVNKIGDIDFADGNRISHS